MILKVINKLLGRKSPIESATKASAARSARGANSTRPKKGDARVEIGLKVHKIKPALVDKRATDVCTTLQQAGYEAYIVGGAVRDLLLGLSPKDFDVATNATPEEVKALFRRAFIIGRRFRIVHVVYGRGRDHEVIEVTTFRANVDNATAHQVKGNEQSSKKQLMHVKHAVDSTGRVLRDNVWGRLDEDAARRDFTINAMYYDLKSQIVVDYHGGIDDAKAHRLRMIGDAETRYREDPIRIIRAIRFAAKLSPLGFKLSPETAKPLIKLKGLLLDVPPSRMFDEMLKLFQTGHAIASVAALKNLGLDEGLYPLQDLIVARGDNALVKQALIDTDSRVAEGKPVAPSFLLACVLWQDVQQARVAMSESHAGRIAAVEALQLAVDQVFENKIGDISGRGKLGADMREIWLMQLRFERRTGKGATTLVQHLRYRASVDFLRLRSLVGEVDTDLVVWWEAFALADDQTRAQMQSVLPKSSAAKSLHTQNSALPSADGVVRKRRRRRSRGGGDSKTDKNPSGTGD